MSKGGSLEKIINPTRNVILSSLAGLPVFGFFNSNNAFAQAEGSEIFLKVNMSWNSALESENISHYVVEVSQDGKRFFPLDQEDSGGTRLNCVPAATWVSGESFVELEAEPWRTYQYRVKSVDSAGNMSEPCPAISVNYSLFRYSPLDRTPPVLVINSHDSIAKDGHVELSGAVYDAESLVSGIIKFSGDITNLKSGKLDGGNWSYSFDLTKRDACVIISAKDILGNSTNQSLCFNYADEEPPELFLDTYPDSVLEGEIINLSGQVRDNSRLVGFSIVGDATVRRGPYFNYTNPVFVNGAVAINSEGIWKGNPSGDKWHASLTLNKAGTNNIALDISDGAGNHRKTLVQIIQDWQDSDGDGLKDLYETRVLHTNPYNFDTDGDGTGDGDELRLGYDCMDAADNLKLTFRSDRILGKSHLSLEFGVKDGLVYGLERNNFDLTSGWERIADFRTEIVYDYSRLRNLPSEYGGEGDLYPYEPEPKCEVVSFPISPNLIFNQSSSSFYFQSHTHAVSVSIPIENACGMYRLRVE